MEISDILSEQILETQYQIKGKFGIVISYSHPMGNFITENSDFIIIQTGEYNEDLEAIDYGKVYLVEFNEFQHETEGVFSRYNGDIHQKSERISDFLINFHQWLKNGEIQIEEYREFKKWKWKPLGDGRFEISEKNNSYFAFIEEIREPELQAHIILTYK